MNTLNQDIFSNYPLLSQRLRNVSKRFEEDTLKGVCDLDITNYDIVNYIIPRFENYGYGHRAYFIVEHVGEESVLKAYIVNKHLFQPQNNNYFSRMMIELNQEHGYFRIARRIPGTSNYDEIKKTMISSLKFSLYFDVLTIRDFYNSRHECVSKIGRYVNTKVLDYFNNVVKLINTEEYQLILYLYLIANCVVLNINLSYDFKEIIIKNEEYIDYITNLKPIIDRMYLQIVESINKF